MTSRARAVLFGVGLGPGDPELMTIKARRVIEAADVVAYPIARRGPGVARTIAASVIGPDQIELAMTYPVTTEETDHPGGYEAALEEFYDASAAQIAAHLDRGRIVAVLCEGDPFLYGSFMYLHDRLAHRYRTEVIPGVASFSAAAAAAGAPLVRRDEVLTILPGTLPPDKIAEHLRNADAAVVMKLGRTFPGVREAAQRAGVAERAIHVARAGSEQELISPLAEVEIPVPYMSLLLVPSVPADTDADPHAGELIVVGLGPAGPGWLTPEATSALALADAVVGYTTYLARVPVRADQTRHGSDNRAEAERARAALDLAASGQRVAVVSSGDPGIYAMASAVFEAIDQDAPRYSGVGVRVVPGVSAMQAAAARVGAPLGHDFCVISLSDQLKPWSVIERRLDAAGGADLVVAIYNPASRTRRDQLESAREVLLRHRDPGTPVVVARDVGGPEEAIMVTTLAGFDAPSIDMRTLIIVGSSMTRVIEGDPPRVYTSRRYPA